MSDLISRQAVLDELEKRDWQELYLPIHFKQILDDVPSAENKGTWIPNKHNDHFHCDKCGNDVDLLGGVASNFCANCGADMRGE